MQVDPGLQVSDKVLVLRLESRCFISLYFLRCHFQETFPVFSAHIPSLSFSKSQFCSPCTPAGLAHWPSPRSPLLLPPSPLSTAASCHLGNSLSPPCVPSSEACPVRETSHMGMTRGRTDCCPLLPLLVALGVAAVNQAIKEGKAAQTERVLRNPAVALRGVVPDYASSYQQALESAAAKKQHPGNAPGSPPLPCPPLLTPATSCLL